MDPENPPETCFFHPRSNWNAETESWSSSEVLEDKGPAVDMDSLVPRTRVHSARTRLQEAEGQTEQSDQQRNQAGEWSIEEQSSDHCRAVLIHHSFLCNSDRKHLDCESLSFARFLGYSSAHVHQFNELQVTCD